MLCRPCKGKSAGIMTDQESALIYGDLDAVWTQSRAGHVCRVFQRGSTSRSETAISGMAPAFFDVLEFLNHTRGHKCERAGGRAGPRRYGVL